MLPLAYRVVPLIRMCIKVVRLHVLPVASVAVVEATLTPSTHIVNAVLLRLKVIECQLPLNAVPPENVEFMIVFRLAGSVAKITAAKLPGVAEEPPQ